MRRERPPEGRGGKEKREGRDAARRDSGRPRGGQGEARDEAVAGGTRAVTGREAHFPNRTPRVPFSPPSSPPHTPGEPPSSRARTHTPLFRLPPSAHSNASRGQAAAPRSPESRADGAHRRSALRGTEGPSRRGALRAHTPSRATRGVGGGRTAAQPQPTPRGRLIVKRRSDRRSPGRNPGPQVRSKCR